MKLSLLERAHYAGVEVEPEVYGLFADLVPSLAPGKDGELAGVRQRYGPSP